MELLTIGGGIQTIQEWIVSLGIPESFAPLLTAAVCVITASLVSVGVMAVIWRYRKTLLRGRDLKLDRFTAPGFPAVSLFNALRIPVPSFSFDLSGMKGVATSLGVVGIAFALAFTFVVVQTDDTPMWPEAGAVYALGSPDGTIGEPLPPDPMTPSEASHTLEVRLADGTRLESLVVDLQMGKPGLTDCVSIERASGTGYLWVDEFSMDGFVAPTLTLNASYIHQLTLSGDVDGHTTGPTQDSSGAPDITFASLRGSSTYAATGRVDRLLISLLGDAYIKTVTITGKCSIGGADLDFIKAGTVSLTNVKIGDDGDIQTAAVVIGNDTVVSAVTDNFTDKSIIVK